MAERRSPDAATRRRNHGAFGSRRERQVAELLRAAGWVVFRSSGSFGVCDLVALRASPLGLVEHEARMIEVKGTARSPWVAWGPAERQALIESASRAGATPLLAWWPPGRELTWYSESEWP